MVWMRTPIPGAKRVAWSDQIRVRMPHALMTHHPRTASYRTKPPAATRAKQIQRPSSDSSKPAAIRPTPPMPRTKRPLVSRFREKNLFMRRYSTALSRRKKEANGQRSSSRARSEQLVPMKFPTKFLRGGLVGHSRLLLNGRSRSRGGLGGRVDPADGEGIKIKRKIKIKKRTGGACGTLAPIFQGSRISRRRGGSVFQFS